MPPFDWKDLIKQVAPVLGTALGGPLAGSAVAAIATALLGKPGTEEEIATALAAATPEQILAIKKADQDYAVRMKEADIKFEELSVDDRKSARQLATNDLWTPRLLAGGVTSGFFGTLGYILTHGVAVDTQGGAVVLVLIGALGTAWTGVMAFYFGSTSSSRGKDETISKALGR